VLDFAEVPPHMFTPMFTCRAAPALAGRPHILRAEATVRLIRPSGAATSARGPQARDVRRTTVRLAAGWNPQWAGTCRVSTGRPTHRGSPPSREQHRDPAPQARDGRFGSGPSKVRPRRWTAGRHRPSYLGTRTGSDRKDVVRRCGPACRTVLVARRIRGRLGNGGTTAFWDIAVLNLSGCGSQHLVFGEFSSKFADAATAAPFLSDPSVVRSDPGTHPHAQAEPGVDVYALTHNETSTGVAMPLRRVAGADDDALVLVDATSGAGGLPVDVAETDVYYFAPQKSFASDGGLWLALMSPAAVERVAEVHRTGRWVPAFSDLQIAIGQLAAGQTYKHAGPCHPLPCSPTSSTGSTPRAGCAGPRRERPTPHAGSTTGPRSRLRDAVRDRPGTASASSAPSTSPTTSTRGGRKGVARQRDRRHRAVPQARPQPAAHRDVPAVDPATSRR
jgi:hypothetical protein